MGRAIVWVVGLLSVGHYVVTQIMWEEWLWLILGLIVLPLTAAIWPFVAWAFNLLGGGWALVFYAIVGLGFFIDAREF